MSVSTSQRSEVSGSALQRLDRLTLRVTDDASLESLTQLAELRNAAFDELEATSGRPWPPRVEEHFTRASGLPEICLSQFNSSTLAAGIYHHGALTVRRFIDAATAHRLRTGIDRTFTARARTLRGAHSPDDARWWTPFIGRYSPGKLAETRAYNKLMKAVSLVDSPQMLHTVLAAYKASGLQALLSEHFGERPVLAANKATLRIVPPDTPTAWHQDGSFMGAGAIKAVNVWLAL
ncbi:MAG: hypothetical protein KDI09_00975, partial [Halioglobus sp.]|nr:hypothetical protein [Halioglobus sp.]